VREVRAGRSLDDDRLPPLHGPPRDRRAGGQRHADELGAARRTHHEGVLRPVVHHERRGPVADIGGSLEDEREQILVIRRRAHAEGRALETTQEILIGH